MPLDLLMYSEKFKLEGLVSSPSFGEGNKEEILKTIDLYEKDLPKLQKHQKELLKIYTNVSNQLSLDKLKDSIQELVNPNNDLIYTHFSRIKSEIQNHFEPHVAHQYFINGDKGMPKKINLIKDKILFEQPIL